MKTISRLAFLFAPLLLAACHKKEEPAPAPAAAAADPAKLTAEQAEQAERQAKLDYGTMEDKYINDPLAQWASGATASSSYGDKAPDPYYLPTQMIGMADGKVWHNKSGDIGFEWVQLDYAKPVQATEVRLIVDSGDGVEALNKVELQDTDGKWTTIWSGLSEVKQDRRGNRTWFVRTFPKTAYKVKAVKYTVANNVKTGAKRFDAAQLVG